MKYKANVVRQALIKWKDDIECSWENNQFTNLIGELMINTQIGFSLKSNDEDKDFYMCEYPDNEMDWYFESNEEEFNEFIDQLRYQGKFEIVQLGKIVNKPDWDEI